MQIIVYLDFFCNFKLKIFFSLNKRIKTRSSSSSGSGDVGEGSVREVNGSTAGPGKNANKNLQTNLTRPNNNARKNNKKSTKKSNKTNLSNSSKIFKLKCYYTNATSLNADKIAELELKACLEEYHLIFITETWFNETSVPSLKNYDLFRRDRGSNGGGVCIYVRKGLDSIEIADENLEKVLNGKNSEQLWRCVSLNNQLILIGCIYRPPPSSDHTKNQKVDEEIIKSLFYAKKAVDKNVFSGLFVAGDFNFPYISWDKEGAAAITGSSNSPGEKFLKLLNDEFITQNVWLPTFRQANGEMKNTLDYILTDNPDRVSNLNIEDPLSTTKQAHLSITCEIVTNTSIKSKFSSKKFAYSKGDYEKIKQSINAINWQEKMSDMDTNTSYSFFMEAHDNICKQFIPKLKQKNVKPRAPWINENVLSLSAKKKKLWHKNQATKWKIASLVKEYERTRKEVKKESKKATISFEQALANDKKNPKLLHAYVSSRQTTRDPISAMRNKSNDITNNKKEIATILNEQFASVFVDEPADETLPDLPSRTKSNLNDLDINTSDITHLLTKLDKYKSCGTDNIHSFVLSSCASSWAVPLALIFRKSLDRGEVPSPWLEANITPLYKKKAVV